MNGLITILGTVPDPLTGNAQRHDLLELLTIALVASICGCQTCVDMADFAEDREPLFREFLRLKNGLPSHDTFSRLFWLIDPDALSSAFGLFLTALGSQGVGTLAIDGKTLRRSFDRASRPNASPRLCGHIGASRTASSGSSTPPSRTEPEHARITAPKNLATIRKLALNVLNTARHAPSIRRKRTRSGGSDAFARSIIGQMR